MSFGPTINSCWETLELIDNRRADIQIRTSQFSNLNASTHKPTCLSLLPTITPSPPSPPTTHVNICRYSIKALSALYKIFLRRVALDPTVTPGFIKEALAERNIPPEDPRWAHMRGVLFKVGLGLMTEGSLLRA